MAGHPHEGLNEKLARAVMNALWRSEPMRALDLDSLHVEAWGDKVVLRGLVASEARRYEAAQLARSVPGVRDVVNELLTDEGLERRVALALARHELSRQHRIAVRVAGGVAALYGAVPGEETAEAVRRVALQVPGITGVESRLRVVRPGVRVILAWQSSVEGRPLQPATREEAPEDAGAEPQRAEAEIRASPTGAGAEGST